MIILLAIIDILCALSLLIMAFGYAFPPFQMGFAILLFAKGIAFPGNLLSVIDMICAIVMVVLLWVSLPVVALCMGLYLGVKGCSSLM